MKKFVQLPAVQKSYNVECLRLFYDQVETSVRNLKTLGVETTCITALLAEGGTEHKRASAFCNKENDISHKCLKVLDPKTRLSILRRKKLCFICFKAGHLSVNCSKFRDYKCKKCSANHNISVCSRILLS